MIEDKALHEGEWLSLNGSTGEVIIGKQPLCPPALSGDLETFMSWVDEVRKLKVSKICFKLKSAEKGTLVLFTH